MRDAQTFACADFKGISDVIHEFLKLSGSIYPKQAAIAVATTVSGDQINFVNRQWSFSQKALQKNLGLEQLVIINDFKALALSLPLLEEKDRRKIGGGSPVPDAPIALIGPGTGLGMSGLIRSQEGWIPLQSEGGHATFASADEQERSVCRILEKQFGHVSLERLLSGPGLVNIYDALSKIEGLVPEQYAPSVITRHALAGNCFLCRNALNLFCGALGTAAGNLALTLGARGGVYIGGGMVPRFVDFFEQSAFRHRFESKGRFSNYLSAIPTYVITAANPALKGLAAALI
jgi:glucokinase